MSKSPVAIIAALIAAATMFASTAEAGFRIRLGFGGPLPSFNAYGNGGGGYEHRHHRQRYIARRIVKKEKTYVAKRDAEPKVAKSTKSAPKREDVAAVPAIDPNVIADSENSSITTASLEPEKAASAPETKPVTPVAVKSKDTGAEPVRKSASAAGKLDCKKFFPSVGMTLTVPCE
jgi:hypothetical protein